jgi:arginyl-tRNA synthetase
VDGDKQGYEKDHWIDAASVGESGANVGRRQGGLMEDRYQALLTAVEQALDQRLRGLAPASAAAETHDGIPRVVLTPARDARHGDFATPVALAAAKIWKRNPLEIARALAEAGTQGLPEVARIEAAPPGFVNVTMTGSFWSGVVREVLERGEADGA